MAILFVCWPVKLTWYNKEINCIGSFWSKKLHSGPDLQKNCIQSLIKCICPGRRIWTLLYPCSSHQGIPAWWILDWWCDITTINSSPWKWGSYEIFDLESFSSDIHPDASLFDQSCRLGGKQGDQRHGAHPHHVVHLAIAQLVEDVNQPRVREVGRNVSCAKHPALGRWDLRFRLSPFHAPHLSSPPKPHRPRH